MSERVEVKKIVSFAKEEIDGAGCRTMDTLARTYCDLLEELGEEEASMEVYNYYNDDEDGD